MRSGSGLRQELPPSRPSRSMFFTTRLPIVLALTLLPAMAFASPPDPSWVAGIFDGADGDDIVSLVYETCAASPATPSHLGPLPCLLEMSLDGIVRPLAGGRFTRIRLSPPVLCSPEFACVFTSLPPPQPDTEAPITLPSITTFWPCPSAVSWLTPSRHSRRTPFPSEAVLEAPRRSSHRRMPTLSWRQSWRTS